MDIIPPTCLPRDFRVAVFTARLRTYYLCAHARCAQQCAACAKPRMLLSIYLTLPALTYEQNTRNNAPRARHLVCLYFRRFMDCANAMAHNKLTVAPRKLRLRRVRCSTRAARAA